VLAASADIIATGLVQSLARPGGNVTGLTFAPEDTVGKRLELLKETVAGLQRVAVLFNPDANPQQVAALHQVAPALGIAMQVFEFRRTEDLVQIALAQKQAAFGGLFVVSDPLVFTNRKPINDFAVEQRLPTIHSLQEYVNDGALMSYGPDFSEFFRQAADFVDKIFRGAKPADLPVQRPTTFRLVINLKAARALGLTIPPTLLTRADEVIE
jgi:putative ABC transport system substrate-binding protein